ncbi:uncharacterized protein [Onthophagus taurus]|uniref:uncharacterized protein n=1 Tax=Onthophagus taurus TaxID=166361 RepID=UPI0039BE558E
MAYKFLQAPMEKEDCTQLYAKYVAEKLNQFDPYTKSVLTHKINTLIFDAELSRLGAAPNGSQCFMSPSQHSVSPLHSVRDISLQSSSPPLSVSPSPQPQYLVVTSKLPTSSEQTVITKDTVTTENPVTVENTVATENEVTFELSQFLNL